jgi:thiamine biosynthesis lipoprotein
MPHIEHRFKAMGGLCRLSFDCPAEDVALQASQSAEAEVRRLEAKYSRYQPDSLTSRINRAAGSAAVEIDDETAGLLGFAQSLWQQSDGLFDLTSGILRQAWDFKSDRLPLQAEIDRLLPLIGWDRVQWDEHSISLPRAGMEIDLGGCVKEHASDSAAAVLAKYGIQRGLVDLAGDIAVVGAGCLSEPWPIGIRHPARRRSRAVARVSLTRGGLASSGDYERCIQLGGQRYGHILNPITGWPVQGLVAVSVIADQCLVAGGSATIAMLRPEAAALEWLAGLGLPWLAVDAELHCHGDIEAS